MKNKKELEAFKFENSLLKLILSFKRNYERLPKIIKNGELFDDSLIEYYLIVKTLYTLILNDEEVKVAVQDETNKLKNKDFDKLKKDLVLQIEWCENQMKFRNKVRQQTNEPIVDYKKFMKEKVIKAEEIFKRENKKNTKEEVLGIEDKRDYIEIRDDEK